MIDLRTPTESEFERIKNLIHELELDDRNLQQQQFIAAFEDGELAGFGRIREHADCSEICSLGTVTRFRRKGICKLILQDLIKKAKKDSYVVCIIPDFFKPFGFEIVHLYPDAIQDKLNYCTVELVVPEKYVVMKKHRPLQ